MKRISTLLALLLVVVANGAFAQIKRGYTEGVVAQVTSIRVH